MSGPQDERGESPPAGGVGPPPAFRDALFRWAVGGGLRQFPWRAADARPFEVLVAEVLLARTPADRVARVLPEVLDAHPDPVALAAADEAALADQLRPLGLQNRRAAALVEVGATLADRAADGRPVVPRDVATMRELPRVGPYAAAATACFAFGRRRAVVDANVTRVYGRVCALPGGADGSGRGGGGDGDGDGDGGGGGGAGDSTAGTPDGAPAADPGDDDLWALARTALPPADGRWAAVADATPPRTTAAGTAAAAYSLALLDFAAATCRARAPDCGECPARGPCRQPVGD